jgi:hypothetical protein
VNYAFRRFSGKPPRVGVDNREARTLSVMSPFRFLLASAPASWRRSAALLAGLFVVAIGGCASDLRREHTTLDPLRQCASLFKRDEARILHAGVRDAQYRAIPGHPYLRIDRFHAALTDRLGDGAARATWLRQLAAFDRASRRIEHRNLAPDKRPAAADIAALDDCAQRSTAALLADDNAFASLLARVGVDDNYLSWWRALGLYPLAAQFVLEGVARLHASEGRYFTAAEPSTPHPARDATYGFTDADESDGVAGIVAQASRDVLGVPLLDATSIERLFAAHSPVFAVDGDGAADRIGRVTATGAHIHVDETDPVVYTYVSYTRFDGAILIQLNYVVWFPARARRSPFDIYAGPLDGITWRVTLDNDGTVLLADTMHNCGCYYMAFPGRALERRTGIEEFAEPLWVPQALPPIRGARFVIQLSGGEHYVRGIAPADDGLPVTPLRTVPYDALKNLALSGGVTRNLFGPDGLVDESARAERFVLWPMGIRSAGAMREAGHHAIAFVGKRHFDDPDLLDRYFARSPSLP